MGLPVVGLHGVEGVEALLDGVLHPLGRPPGAADFALDLFYGQPARRALQFDGEPNDILRWAVSHMRLLAARRSTRPTPDGPTSTPSLGGRGNLRWGMRQNMS